MSPAFLKRNLKNSPPVPTVRCSSRPLIDLEECDLLQFHLVNPVQWRARLVIRVWVETVQPAPDSINIRPIRLHHGKLGKNVVKVYLKVSPRGMYSHFYTLVLSESRTIIVRQ